MSLIQNKLTISDVRQAAEEIRKKYVTPVDLVPVPIEKIVEIDFRIKPWPIKGLLSKIDIDGFLSKDLETLFVDYDRYYGEWYQTRMRFTLAHELGHIVLHNTELKSANYTTADEWIKFRESMPDETLINFELQAYEFAGRLLVPKRKLMDSVNKFDQKIIEYKKYKDSNGMDQLYQVLGKLICDQYQVSDKVIKRRLYKEKEVHDLIKQI